MRRFRLPSWTLIALLCCEGLTACAPPRSSHIVIGAKNFTEQVVLGELIFQDVASVDNGLVLAGAVPAALLALCADGLLGLLEKRLAVRR